ncbi:MAG: DUF523 and DUF1722 domain-containing protein [bacterium]|nr:DUF523 and DUF1722 domain-containing protein [bacterium]
MDFPKPNIILSRCINIEAVRYDGGITNNEFAKILGNYVNYIPVCPEVSIGLGVPRDPIVIIKENNSYRLYQPKTELDLTSRMEEFSDEFLDSLREIDGFLLRSKSPSCGVSGTKIFDNPYASKPIEEGKGIFAKKVLEKFGYLAVEDELRLKNIEIMNHFLIKVFAFTELRETLNSLSSIKELINFHQRYKYLLMAYSQKILRTLGRVIAGIDGSKLQEIVFIYREEFYKAFSNIPSRGSHINVSQHIFGYFSKYLSNSEKERFFKLLDNYRKGLIHTTDLIRALRDYNLRYNNNYLTTQRYLNPYPEEFLLYKN